MSRIDKLIEKIQKDKLKLAQQYNVKSSSIVYIGDNHYIIVKEGQMIRI